MGGAEVVVDRRVPCRSAALWHVPGNVKLLSPICTAIIEVASSRSPILGQLHTAYQVSHRSFAFWGYESAFTIMSVLMILMATPSSSWGRQDWQLGKSLSFVVPGFWRRQGGLSHNHEKLALGAKLRRGGGSSSQIGSIVIKKESTRKSGL